MRVKNACAAASIGAMVVAIGLPLTAMSASAAVVPAPDTIAPTTTGTFPAAAAKRGAFTGNITATFNEPVHVDATTFTLMDAAGTAVVADIRVDPLTNVVTLDPKGKLAKGKLFTATLTAGITDVALNPMAPKSWTFTTAKSENDSFINRVYEHLFNREVDDNGALHFEAELNDVTDDHAKGHVSNGLTSSREFRSNLIARSYSHYLGRGTDPAGLSANLAAMSHGMTISKMESGFIASNEYFRKAGSTNASWVTKLYSDVLGRKAATAEAASWKNRLDNGSGRGTVAMGFVLSGEHLGTVVDDHYRHLLGRGVDLNGRMANVKMLARGGRDEVIIGNILASAEYFGHN